MYKRFNAANVLLSGIAFLLFGSSLLTAGSVPVTNTNDTGAGSLRSAISAAAPGDTVVFNAGLAGQTILLTSGELTINQNLTIIGLGAANLTISGNSASRIFFITGGVTVNITKLMIRDGFATGFTHGGGIHNEFSTVNLDSCILFSNLADISDYGGGIYTSGDMTIMRSIIDSNEADYGGGIYNDGGIVTVQQSAVIHNLARLDGGGFYNFNDNTINLYASTLSHNYAAGSGGGFYNTSTGNVQSSTITQNRANSVNGGGVFNSGAMTMLNTIVAGNISVAAPDYQGPVTSSGYNLIGVSAGSTGFGTTGDILDQPAGIGLLQNNGGFAPTHALLPGSIAIDAGNDFIGADQRGFPRPFDDPNYSNIDDGNDIGAFESQTPLPPDPLLVLNTNNSGFGSLRDAISFANSNAGPDTVRFAAVLSGDSIAIASVLNLTDDSTMVDADINGDSIPDIILQPSSSGYDGFDINVGAQYVTIQGFKIIRKVQSFSNGITVRAPFAKIQFNYFGTEGSNVRALSQNLEFWNNGVHATIYRNVFANAAGPGMRSQVFTNIDTTKVIENFIGTDATGTIPMGNNYGIWLAGEIIEKGWTIKNNVISGNVNQGVYLRSSFGGRIHGNTIIGNKIGTDVSGTVAIPNGQAGVEVGEASSPASYNKIGGPLGSDRNIISGNTGAGVLVARDSNTVENNFIGIDVTGNGPLGNQGHGISLFNSSANVIRNNVISDNGSNELSGGGLVLDNAHNNSVIGNFIGLDAPGTAAIPNQIGGGNGAGILLDNGSSFNQIGDGTPIGRNVIGDNGWGGDAANNIDVVSGSHHNTFAGNYVGTDVSGTVSVVSIARVGFYLVNAYRNQIGVTGVDGGNVIAGHSFGPGVELFDADSNDVRNNRIGLASDGSALGNDIGINIIGGASHNKIGGNGAGDQNLISSNNTQGITISDAGSDSNYVLGNFIGVDMAGATGLGNSLGILITSSATGNFIGDGQPGGNNIISGSAQEGVLINGADGNFVYGNFIGTDVTGVNAIPNNNGVMVQNANRNIIGDDGPNQGNLISGNNFFGALVYAVFADARDNVIRGNKIGSQIDGISPLPNGIHGVRIYANSGNATNDSIIANTIAFNTSFGIEIEGNGPKADSNIVFKNAIFNNASGGINHVATAQGFVWDPVITTIDVDSTVHGIAAANALVHLYADAGNQGQFYLDTVRASGSGNWAKKVPLFAGYNLTALQDSAHHTSRFSAPVPAVYLDPLLVTTLADDSTLGSLRYAIGYANANLAPDTIRFAAAFSSGDTIYVDKPLPNVTDSLTTIDGGAIKMNVAASGSFTGFSIMSLRAPRITLRNLTFDGRGVAQRAMFFDNAGLGGYFGVLENSRVINFTAVGVHGDVAWVTIQNNWIAANGLAGVSAGPFWLIRGNMIGTDETGTADYGVQQIGVALSAYPGTRVGGANVLDRNIISGNDSAGVLIDNSPFNMVEGNYIGTDASGSAAIANESGIRVLNNSHHTQIGSPIAGGGNVISGNLTYGIYFQNSDTCSVQNNFVGINSAGNTALGNLQDGIGISNSTRIKIGGSLPFDRNIISGNADEGIELAGSDNFIAGNYIGTDATGSAAIANVSGIGVFGKFNKIGDGTASGINVISGNSLTGIYFQSADSNLMSGNFVGVAADGVTPLANLSGGVSIDINSDRNTIGDTVSSVFTNVISSNTGAGISISGRKNIIAGNFIGTDSNAVLSLGNTGEGVFVLNGSSLDTIGLNVIAHNGANGLRYDGATTDSNWTYANSIFNNSLSGIAITGGAQQGVTPPSITGNATVLTDTLISGTAAANSIVQIFADAVDEGEFFIDTAVADAGGNWSQIVNGFVLNYNFTAIQEVNRNSSEFSAPFTPILATAPFFTSAPVTSATADLSYSYNITASDINPDPLTINEIGSAALDQQQTTSNSATLGADQWQSFTAGQTGLLTLIEWNTNGFSSGPQPFTYTLYAGEGTGGAVLFTGNGSFDTPFAQFFPITFADSVAPLVTAGLQYTIRLQFGGTYHQMAVNSSNVYPGGVYFSSSFGLQTSWDLLFRTTVRPTAGALPPWLGLVDNGDGTAVLSGTPVFGDIGSYPIGLMVRDGAKNGFQNFVLDVQQGAPTVPNGLYSVAGNGQVELKWRTSSDGNFKRYRIFAGTTPGPTTQVDSTAGGNANDTTKTITSLTNGQLYYFRVLAVDSTELASAYSNEDAAVPVVEAGRALNFTGLTGNRVEYVANPSAAFGDGNDFTLMAWIKPTAIATEQVIFHQRFAGVGSWQIVAGLTSAGQLEFNIDNFSAGGWDFFTGSASIPVNQWTHVAFKIESGVKYIYINGVLDASESLEANVIGGAPGNGVWANGGRVGDNDLEFFGDIDEPSIWNRALNITEINNLKTTPLRGDESGLVGSWHFDEPLIATAYDATPLGTNSNFITGGISSVLSGAMAPLPVIGVNTTPYLDSTVTVDWSDNTENDLDYYIVYRSTTNGFIPIQTDSIARVNKPASQWDDNSVQKGDVFYYRIAAVDSAGQIGPYSAQAVGTYPVGLLSATPSPVNFGNIAVGSNAILTTKVYANGGWAEVTGSSFDFGTAYSLATPLTLPDTLSTGDTMLVDIQFTPTAFGFQSDTLRLANNTSVNPFILALNGTGVSGSLAATVSPMNFGSVVWGDSLQQIVKLYSNGGAVSIAGINLQTNNQFRIDSTTGPPTLFTGDTAAVFITYKPNGFTTDFDTILVANNSGVNPLKIGMSGTGVGGVLATLTPNIYFGTVPVLDSAKMQIHMFAPNGYVQVNSAALKTGAHFQLVPLGTVPTVLGPGDTLKFESKFLPVVVAALFDSVIVSNNSLSAFSVRLDGNSIVPQVTPVRDTLYVIEDAKVMEQQPAVNFGAAGDIYVYGSNAGGGGAYPNDQSKAYVKFNLAPLPVSADILSATLKVSSPNGFAYNYDPFHYAFFVSNDAWTEGSIVWNTRPAQGTLLGQWFAWANGAGSWVYTLSSDPLRSQIAAERAGDGILSMAISNETGAYYHYYYSKEGTADPNLWTQLIVDYLPSTLATLTPIQNMGSVQVGDSSTAVLKIFATAGTVTISAVNLQNGGDYSLNVAGGLPQVLNLNDTMYVTVKFKPTTFGAINDIVDVVNTTGVNPFQITLNGTGAIGTLASNFASINYGNVLVGDSVTQNVKFYTTLGAVAVSDTAFNFGTHFSAAGPLVLPDTLFAGDTLTIPVKFRPRNFGALTDTLQIANNSAVSLMKVAFDGSGIAGTLATLTPNVNFGSVQIGDSLTQTVKIYPATGGVQINNAMFNFGTQFNVGNTLSLPRILYPGDTLLVDVEFKPTLTDTLRDTISTANNSITNPFKISLVARGAVGPIIASQSSINFGGVHIGDSLVTIVKLYPSTIGLLINNASTDFGSQFSFNTTPALPNALAIGDTLFMAVKFKPNNFGAFIDTIRVNSNALISPLSIALGGTGLIGTLATAGASVNFGVVQIGDSVQQDIKFYTTVGAVNLDSIKLDGNSDFKIVGFSPAIPSILKRTDTLRATVKFKPSALSTRTDSMRLFNNSVINPLRLFLSGVGNSGNLATLPSSVNFNNVFVGDSLQQTIKVFSATGNITVSAVSLESGTDYQIVSVSSGLPHALPLGDTLLVEVKFKPANFGSRSDRLVLNNNSLLNPVKINLSGTGTGGTLAFTPAVIDFGSVLVTDSAVQTIKLFTTAGNAIIGSGLLDIGNDFTIQSVSGLPDTIGTGDTVMAVVKFKPTVFGALSDTIRVSNNSTVDPLKLALTGVGQAGTLVSLQSSVDFGSVMIGDSAAVQVKFYAAAGQVVIDSVNLLLYDDVKLSVPGMPVILTANTTDTLSVNLKFVPASYGNKLDTLRMWNNAAVNPFQLALTAFADTNAFPNAFRLKPVDNDNVSGSRTPTLAWQGRGDDDGDALNYTVQIASANDFLSIVQSLNVTDTTSTVSSPLDSAGNYYWRVIASDGLSETYSDTGFFSIDATQPEMIIAVLTSTVLRNAISIYAQSNENLDSIAGAYGMHDASGALTDSAALALTTVAGQPGVYYTPFVLPSSGTLFLTVTGFDFGGNQTTISRSYTAVITPASAAIALTTGNGAVSLNGAKGSLAKDGFILLSRQPKPASSPLRKAIETNSWTEVGERIELISTTELKKDKYLQLTVRYSGDELQSLKSQIGDFDERKIGFYFKENGEWQYLGGEGSDGQVTTRLNKFIELAMFYNPEHVFLPKKVELSQNYPNPFNPTTTIRFGLPEEGKVKLIVYNILGQKVKELLSTTRNAGYHEVRWDGKNEIGQQVATGVYIYRLETPKGIVAKKMLLVK